LATLSTASQLPKSSEASFSLQHSWDSPFKAFLLTRESNYFSVAPLRPCTFPKNLLGLPPVLQRFIPTSKAVSLSAPRRFSSGRNLLLSWASDLSGSPADHSRKKASPFLPSLLVLRSHTLASLGPGTTRSSAMIRLASPSEKGAGLSGLSSPTVLTQIFRT